MTWAKGVISFFVQPESGQIRQLKSLYHKGKHERGAFNCEIGPPLNSLFL